MGTTLDGVVAETGAVFEAKFMLPWGGPIPIPPQRVKLPCGRSCEGRTGRLAAFPGGPAGGRGVRLDRLGAAR